MCTFLSVIALLLCALPIGMEYQSVRFDDIEHFIGYVESGYNLKSDRNRAFDPDGNNVEERYIEGERTYVVQRVEYEGYDGEYYYGYYLSDVAHPDSISVELEKNGVYTRIECVEYYFGNQSEWAFNVNSENLIDYEYNSDGTVTAVTDAEEFEGYNTLIALCGTAFAVSGGCTVILTAFRLKLRRVRDDQY